MTARTVFRQRPFWRPWRVEEITQVWTGKRWAVEKTRARGGAAEAVVSDHISTLRQLIDLAEGFRGRGIYTDGEALLDAAPSALNALVADLEADQLALREIAGMEYCHDRECDIFRALEIATARLGQQH